MYREDHDDAQAERETLNREGDHEEPMTYGFGWHPYGHDPRRTEYRYSEVRDRERAVELLREAVVEMGAGADEDIEDRVRARRVRRAWAAFSDYVGALDDLGDDFSALGPDGYVYWVARIDED